MVSGNDSSSNGSNYHDLFSTAGFESASRIFSSKSDICLEKLLIDAEYDYSDAEIVAEGISVGVNRCILALKSQFFHELFKRSMQEGKAKYDLSDLVPDGKVGYESFTIVLHYLYTGTLKASPAEIATCVDNSCAHDACAPAINHNVELMYASAAFQIKELVALVEHRLLKFVDKAFVEDMFSIVVVAFICQLDQLLLHCIQRFACSDLDDIILEQELPSVVFKEIEFFRNHSQKDTERNTSKVDSWFSKRIRRVHKALDSDDVELLKLLLEESDITLEDAYALHYAAAYCDPKVVSELLSLGIADLNLRNSHGYTVLHIAARRKEPSIIVDLLSNGARVSDITKGQTAITICRRRTLPKDYNGIVKAGQPTNPHRLCIDILERELFQTQLPRSMGKSSTMVADDFETQLPYLENRVALAKLLFPVESKLAMEIANADMTSEFDGLSSKASYRNLRSVDLNEKPKQEVKRLQALQKAVEICQRFFPICIELVDKLMEDDIEPNLLLEKYDAEVERMKQNQQINLQEPLKNACNTDRSDIKRRGLSLSSASETDTLLLERARNLLRGNKGAQKKQMMERRYNCTSPSSSFSCSFHSPMWCD